MSDRQYELDILRFYPLDSLIRWRGFPYVFQGIALVVFLMLAYLGFGALSPETIDGKLFAKSNIVTLVIWGLWWPAMIWMAVLFGRLWCMVCPLELVSNLTERLARKIGIKQRTVGTWLRSGTLVIILYATIQMLVAGIDLHRSPSATSVFLLVLLGGALVAGFIYKDRAFCRAFCPVGMLLNAYGRGSMIAVRSGSSAVCGSCTGKDCLMACNRAKADGRSCPSLLNPPRLNSNKDCLVCGQCIKACEPDNMRLLLRPPFSSRDERESIASRPLTAFVGIALGFVTSELASESKSTQDIFLWVPERAAALSGLPHLAGWFEGIWTLGVFPVLLGVTLGGFIAFITRDTIAVTLRRIALPVAVIVSAGHMCKALAKFTSWAGYLPFALTDPTGAKTAWAISSQGLSAPQSLLDIHGISYISIGLLLSGTLLAFREMHLANPALLRTSAAPKLALAGLFIFIVTGWGA